jgi:TatD DNase family protein
MKNEQKIEAYDFHCHIDLHNNPVALIERCEKDRIAVFAVTTTPKAWQQNQIWTKNSNYVYAAVGLHPELVGARYHELDLLDEKISECRLVGEVGLDGSHQHRSSYEKQKQVFASALKSSQKYGGRVMSIHSRRAAKDVVALIIEHVDPNSVLTILHWFSASISDAQRAIDAGCYFSVNSAMLKSKNGRSLLKIIPRGKLLTETDSPFTEVSGRKSEPSDVVQTVVDLAGFYGEPVEKLKKQIDRNANSVFMFAGIN